MQTASAAVRAEASQGLNLKQNENIREMSSSRETKEARGHGGGNQIMTTTGEQTSL